MNADYIFKQFNGSCRDCWREALVEASISTTAPRSVKCHLESSVESQSTHHCSTIANSQRSMRNGTGQHQEEMTTLDSTAKCNAFKIIWPDSVA